MTKGPAVIAVGRIVLSVAVGVAKRGKAWAPGLYRGASGASKGGRDITFWQASREGGKHFQVIDLVFVGIEYANLDIF